MLKHCGADVVAAGDADEARRLIRERAVTLMLTDINLPPETGFEFGEWVRHRAPEPVRKMPIIAITATSPSFAVHPHPAIDVVLRKPVELDERCRVIENILRQRSRRQ
jgi:DNA-binding response OmpR family regulator